MRFESYNDTKIFYNFMNLMAIVQKPFNQSNLVAKSGPPAWKELPTWYQISDAGPVL